jgi:hypothetical protein
MTRKATRSMVSGTKRAVHCEDPSLFSYAKTFVSRRSLEYFRFCPSISPRLSFGPPCSSSTLVTYVMLLDLRNRHLVSVLCFMLTSRSGSQAISFISIRLAMTRYSHIKLHGTVLCDICYALENTLTPLRLNVIMHHNTCTASIPVYAATISGLRPRYLRRR